jgi:hypothetical protein
MAWIMVHPALQTNKEVKRKRRKRKKRKKSAYRMHPLTRKHGC